MNKRLIFTILAIAFAVSAQGQSLMFENTKWDFGRINEADGPVEHIFPFVNNTQGELEIGNLSPSCDCIKARIDKTKLKPGEMGEISLVFSPAGAAGTVVRLLEIYSPAGRTLAVLSISANVNPAIGDLVAEYRHHFSEVLKTNTTDINFGYVPLGKESRKWVHVINASDKEISIKAIASDQGGNLEIDYPQSLGPKETADIELSYIMPESDDYYGSFTDSVIFFVNGQAAENSLKISGVGIEDFSLNKMEAPSGRYYPSSITMKKGLLSGKYSGSITLFNDGKGDLIIRDIYSEDILEINIKEGEKIKSGGEKEIRIVSSSAKPVFQIITNDPKRTLIEFTIN